MGANMDLAESRKHASQLSGGTSGSVIKTLVRRLLDDENAGGSLLDYGAGKGELLAALAGTGQFSSLAGMDLFPPPDGLPEGIAWHQQDLNDVVATKELFDTVICSETIEHLENPRHTFRSLAGLLKPGGLLVLTMPNQESIRAYAGLCWSGHFIHFVGASYPAHITALLRLDLKRLCQEVGLTPRRFRYSGSGSPPKMTFTSWQRLSFGLLRGRLYSDNIGMAARRQ